MTEFEKLQKELETVKAKIIKLQTLKEQAQKECSEIEQKFGVHSLEELEKKYNDAKAERDKQVALAWEHISKVKEELGDI